MEPLTDEGRRLVEDNLPLVRHVVFQVAVRFPRHVDRDELATAGAVGLVEAARRYQSDRGVPFERFAARRIRGAILDAVRAADWAPRSVRSLARRLEETEQRLANELGRVPTLAESAEQLGVSQAELDRLQDRMARSVILALDHQVADADEELTLLDVVADEHTLEPSEELEVRELHSYLHASISLLPDRHRTVIQGYFLDGRTSIELAAELGVTESRISQLRSEALAMMRDGIEAQYAPVPEVVPTGRAARRKASYAAAIGTSAPWQERIAQPQQPVLVVA